MIAIRKKSTQLLAVAAFGVALMALSSPPAYAVPAAPSEVKQDFAKQRQEWIRNRIDRMAGRLEIKASQQGAWQAYAKALQAATERPAKTPDRKTDAASIARLRADLATAHAQKLAQIADATAKFQEVLSPDQRKTLDQIVARSGRRWHHFHGDGRTEQSEGGRNNWNRQEQGRDIGENRDHEQR